MCEISHRINKYPYSARSRFQGSYIWFNFPALIWSFESSKFDVWNKSDSFLNKAFATFPVIYSRQCQIPWAKLAKRLTKQTIVSLNVVRTLVWSSCKSEWKTNAFYLSKVVVYEQKTCCLVWKTKRLWKENIALLLHTHDAACRVLRALCGTSGLQSTR